MAKNNTAVLDLTSSAKGVNKSGKAILGTLEGPCADIIHPTRNERAYTESL